MYSFIYVTAKNMDEAKRWWNSPEYSRAKKLRHAAAKTNVVFLEGL